MGVVFGVVAGILLGVSDFTASRASRTISSVSVSRTNLIVSGLVAPLLLFVKPVEWTLRDVVLGVLSGITLSGGLVMLYRGYTVARMGIVAPTRVGAAGRRARLVRPVAKGNTPSTVAACGMALGLIALVLTTYQRGGMGSVKIGVVLGVGAGSVVRHRVHADVADLRRRRPVAGDDPTTLRPAVPPRAAAVRQGAHPGAADARHDSWAIGSGLAGGVAIASLKLGYINGSAGPVSVAASQFAAVGVVLVGDLQQGTPAAVAGRRRRGERRRRCL